MKLLETLQQTFKSSGGNELIQGVGKFAKTYGGPMLTAIGVAAGGYAIYKAIALAPEAVKVEEAAAAKKAKEIDPNTTKKAKLGKMEKIEILGPVYKPVIIAGTVALAAVLAGQYCSYKQMIVATGALAAASNKDALDKLKKEAAKQFDKDGTAETQQPVPVTSPDGRYARPNPMDKVWWQEECLGQWFLLSTMEVELVMGAINSQLLNDGKVTMNDIYGIVADYYPEALSYKCDFGRNLVFDSENLMGGSVSYVPIAGRPVEGVPMYWTLKWREKPVYED